MMKNQNTASAKRKRFITNTIVHVILAVLAVIWVIPECAYDAGVDRARHHCHLLLGKFLKKQKQLAVAGVQGPREYIQNVTRGDAPE